jgi:hypothetical protein
MVLRRTERYFNIFRQQVFSIAISVRGYGHFKGGSREPWVHYYRRSIRKLARAARIGECNRILPQLGL